MEVVKYVIFGLLCVIVITVIIVLFNNMKKSSIKKDLDTINVRINALVTIPLAFKLNKAQSIVKRTAEGKEKFDSCLEKYNQTQSDIDQLNTLFEDGDDAFKDKKYKKARSFIEQIKERIDEVEKNANEIDEYLDSFSQKESEQREYTQRLKEEYREVKITIREKSNYLSIAYEGVEKKLEECEDLFSQAEEYMYGGDYGSAQDILDKIDKAILNIKHSCNMIPELVKDGKGVVPILFDETNRQYALARQRGAYLAHINIDERLNKVQNDLNRSIKQIMICDVENVKDILDGCKRELNDILLAIEKENDDYKEGKKLVEDIKELIDKNIKLHNYVDVSFSKDKERFNLNDIEDYLEEKKNDFKEVDKKFKQYSESLSTNSLSASDIKTKLLELKGFCLATQDKLSEFKLLIDKNTSDEERARTQLVKLQVVLNETEVKVKEYHLPTISESFNADLILGRERVLRIKKLLTEIPLDIDELNVTLTDAIDFVYTFYNNVNNIVGVAIMVENAIVFGNKYRSTYQDVDRDLSKAEFSYINGEYTKALTMSIACMEKLFPNKASEKILENN